MPDLIGNKKSGGVGVLHEGRPRHRNRKVSMADNEDYYSDGGETGADAGNESTPESSKIDTETQTALLPKAFFGDKELKPGVKCEVEIKEIYEGDVMVAYVPHGEGKPDESETPENEDEMASMME